MDGKTYPYLALAALAPVGATLLDAHAAFVFASDGTRLLFANAAAVALFDASSVGELLARRFSDLNPIKAQAARLSRVLPTESARLEVLRLGQGVGLATVTAACRRLNLADDQRAVLAIAAGGDGRESVTARAEHLVDALGADDCLAALLNGDGKVLAASGGYDALAPAEEAIDRLVGAALASAERMVARPIAVAGGERPAGAVRFRSDGRDLVLLVVGPREEVQHAPPEPATQTPELPAPTAPPPEAPFMAQEDSAGAELPIEMFLPEEPEAEEISPAPESAGRLVRFVFELDGEGRFTFVSPELAATVGAANGALAGWRWADIAEKLGATAEDVARAIAAGTDFSTVLDWPAGDGEVAPVQLTGMALPNQAGFRGFGAIRVDERRADAGVSSLGLDAVATAAEPATSGEAAPPAATAPGPVAVAPPPPDDDLDVAAQASIERRSPLAAPTAAAPLSVDGEATEKSRAFQHREASRHSSRADAAGAADRHRARRFSPHRRGARPSPGGGAGRVPAGASRSGRTDRGAQASCGRY